MDHAAHVSGRVLAADDRQPVPDAQVLLIPARGGQGETPRMVWADDAGRFLIENVPPGDYRIQIMPPAERAGFISVPARADRPDYMDRLITVQPGLAVEDLELLLSRAAVIAGRVVDEQGRPLSRVRIVLLQAEDRERQAGSGAGDLTDDLGTFRLFNVRPGAYYLRAEPVGGTMFGVRMPPRWGFAPTWYPSAAGPAEAMPIRVDPGQEAAGLEIRMRRGRGFGISGQVLTADGRPWAGAMLELREGNHGSSGAAVAGDGTFTISGLSPGDYVLSAAAGDGSEAAGPVSIRIVDGDVTGLVLRGLAVPRIAGRVGAELRPPGELIVWLVPAAGGRTAYAQSSLTLVGPGLSAGRAIRHGPPIATVKRDGSFEIHALPGVYAVRLEGLPPDQHVTAVVFDGVEKAGFEVEIGPEGGGLEILVERRR